MYKLKIALTRRVAVVAIAGFAAGAVSGYATRPEGSLAISYIAAAGILGLLFLTTLWMVTSSALVRIEGLATSSIRKKTAWPFAAFAILPVLFLPFIDYQSERKIVIYQPPLLDLHWQVTFVLSISLMLVASLLILRFESLRPRPMQVLVSRPALTLALIILAWITAASILEILKTHYLNTPGNNIRTFMDGMNNAFSEKGLLYSGLLQAHGSSLLGVHASFVWFLVYPLFRIWPHYSWLIIISNACLALTAVPIYLLSRQFFSKGLGLLIVLVFLLNRTIIAQPAVADLSEQRFLPLFLISAIYFWYKRKFWPFIVFALLALTIREDVGIVLSILGALSLLKKQSLKWWISPLLIGGTWFVIMFTTVIPAFNPAGETGKALALYPNLGDTTSEILFTLIFKPWILFETIFFHVGHLAAIYGLWQSFGFGVVLMTPLLLLSAPSLAETLLYRSSLGLSHFNSIAICAAMFPAFILGLAAFKKITMKKWQESAAATLVLLTLFSTIGLAYTWFAPARYGPLYNYETAIQVMEMIPSDASAVLPEFMGIKAKPTQVVRNYGQMVYDVNDAGKLDLREEYIVIDTFVPESDVQGQYLDGLRLLREAIEASSEYVLQFEGDDLQLYHHEKPPPARQP